MNRMEFYGALNKYKDTNSSLEHKQNYKYYNKIDLGNGNTRYFYTKAEWDAYQEGKKATPAKAEISKTTYLKNPNGDPVGIKQTNKVITDIVKKSSDNKSNIKTLKNTAGQPFTLVSALDSKISKNLEEKYDKELDSRDAKSPFENEFKDYKDVVKNYAKELESQGINILDRESLKEFGITPDQMYKELTDALDKEVKLQNNVEAAYALYKDFYDKDLNYVYDLMNDLNFEEEKYMLKKLGINSFSDDDVFAKYGNWDEFVDDDDYGLKSIVENRDKLIEFTNDFQDTYEQMKKTLDIKNKRDKIKAIKNKY